jgi:hypothetical protein
MGNHEHYDYDIAWTQDTLKAQLAFPNLHILEKESVTINDVTFVGATLWTDMNKGDEVTIWQVANMMNDFRLIKNSNVMLKHKNNIYKIEDGKLIKGEDGQLVVERVDHYEKPSTWSPEQSYSVHKETLAYFNDTLKDTSKTYVVVGHHAPSPLSIAGGGTGRIFGEGGILDGIGGVAENIANGNAFSSIDNFINTASAAANTYQNIKGLTKAGAAAEGSKVALGVAGAVISSGIKGLSFPGRNITETTKAVPRSFT